MEPAYAPAIRSLFPDEWADDERGDERNAEAVLIPEPRSERGPSAIAVRVDGNTVGYLSDEDASNWTEPIRRIIASGLIPVTTCRIWANEWDGWDEVEFRASVRIGLGDPAQAIPLNDPPKVAHTLLPRSSTVQVTKEDEHFDVLLRYVPGCGRGQLYVTLHERPPLTSRSKPHIEVRIDDQRVGQLTPQTSQRFLPMIQHLEARGLVTACRASIVGSAVAAKVSVNAVKAHEATDEVLDGPPVNLPSLIPAAPDPSDYNIRVQRSLLKPRFCVRATQSRLHVEPSDGSVIRFTKGRGGRYHYVAVRCGDQWHTSATGDWGSINERMTWDELASKLRRFEMPTAWNRADNQNLSLVRQEFAVIAFAVGTSRFAAINVNAHGDSEGEWFTTIREADRERLTSEHYADWSAWSTINRLAQDVVVAVNEWQEF